MVGSFIRRSSDRVLASWAIVAAQKRRRSRLVPAAPSNLAAALGDGAEIVLTWDDVEHATSFAVYASRDGGPEARVALVTVPAYVDLGAAPGETNTYRVRALGAASFWSDFSAPVSEVVPE